MKEQLLEIADTKTLENITVAVINLPHAERLIRRYMCTYRSPYFCFPPHDLLQVATCIREWTGACVLFLDAIAENLDEGAVIKFLQTHRPAYMITLLGVESVATDLQCTDTIRTAVADMSVITYGYYATQFPREILDGSTVDVVLRGDPEASCCTLLSALQQDREIQETPGIACRNRDGVAVLNPPAYLEDLENLPAPDYSMVTLEHYNEMLLGGPFAAVQTSRGCPYHCSYCTSPMDRRLIYRTPEKVVDEVQHLRDLGAHVIRFLDDTFTHDKTRVITICQELIKRDIRVSWSCLSRVDTLDAGMLTWMKQAGCVRVVVGVESYAHKVLQAFGKRIDPDTINERLQLVRDAGIECVGFVIVGGPFEDDESFERTRRGVLAGPYDLIIIDALAVYGGTPLAEKYRESIEFQLIPYISRWRDATVNAVALERERILYRQFYFRPRIIWRQLRLFCRFPARSMRLLFLFFSFMIRPFRKQDRRDLF